MLVGAGVNHLARRREAVNRLPACSPPDPVNYPGRDAYPGRVKPLVLAVPDGTPAARTRVLSPDRAPSPRTGTEHVAGEVKTNRREQGACP